MCAGLTLRSAAVIEVEFHRMRCHFITHDFGHLQFNEAVDEVIVEYAASLEEAAILIAAGKGFTQ